MKHILSPFLLLAFCTIGYSQSRTSANLTEAYRFESNNSQIFDAYARQAVDEGSPSIALFFKAIAKTSSIHAGNLKKVLSPMGVQVAPIKQVIILKTPEIHLDEALKSVRIQAGVKYAEYIDQAKVDGEESAVKALRWIKETEQQSLEIYLTVINALRNNTRNSLPDCYWICPKCGNLYDVPDPEDECSYCDTEKEKFIKIR